MSSIDKVTPSFVGVKIQYGSFSDDDWVSDVCVTDIGRAIMIYVASGHIPDGIPPLTVGKDHNDWLGQYKAQLDWLGKNPLLEIGLGHDDQIYRCSDITEALIKLDELSAAGYHIPESLTNRLTESMF